ncbi:MAG: hypothetical protein JWN28_901 [Candidatus Saccharibacteria bacterium]|nr:hypothetical protein [Candidatus Saccharibacteria bacterium]
MNPNTPQPTDPTPTPELAPTPEVQATPVVPVNPAPTNDVFFPTNPEPVAPQPQFPQPQFQQPLGQPTPQTTPPVKKSRKKLFLIIASVLVGLLLIAGIALAIIYNIRATPEDYENAQALVTKIEAQNEASREAYARSIAIASTEMTAKPVTQDDYKKLLAYDRDEELAASNEKLRTEIKAIEASLDELKNSPALKDKEVRDKYTALRKNADAYILSSQQLFESSPAMAKVVTACFQAETNIFALIDEVLAGADKVVDEINGTTAAYNPDTALAEFEAKPFYVKCNGALKAIDKPLAHPTLEGVRTLMNEVMSSLRTQVTDYAAEYKKGDTEAAAKSFIENGEKLDKKLTASQKEMSQQQDEYIETLDIESKANELKAKLAQRLE